jgi:GxxExxY protein
MAETSGESRARGKSRMSSESSPERRRLLEEDLTGEIIGACYDTFNSLGFGFLESVYVEALRRRLVARGLKVQREALVKAWDQGREVGAFRVDLLVEGRVVVEVKAGELLDPSARRQLYNYLRCTDLQVGLLFHFGPKPRFHRLVSTRNLGKEEDPPSSAGSRVQATTREAAPGEQDIEPGT